MELITSSRQNHGHNLVISDENEKLEARSIDDIDEAAARPLLFDTKDATDESLREHDCSISRPPRSARRRQPPDCDRPPADDQNGPSSGGDNSSKGQSQNSPGKPGQLKDPHDGLQEEQWVSSQAHG